MAGLHRILRRAGIGAAAILLAGVVQAQPVPTPDPNQLPPQETAPPEAPRAPVDVAPPVLPPEEIAPPQAPERAPPSESKRARSHEPASDAEAPPPAAPELRARHGAAVIQALDKITAETMRFEARVGHPVRYKGLVFTVRSCETSAPDEPTSDSVAYVEVRSEPKAQTEEQPSKEIFHGWMFASSPGLNALQHPIYDAWLIACKA